MKVSSIRAERDMICICVQGASGEDARVIERAGVAGDKPGRTLSAHAARAQGEMSIRRFDGVHDRLYSEFTVYVGGEPLEGARFVTDIAPDVPENTEPYPETPTIKALYGTPEDIRLLGIHQSPYNINLPALMTTAPGAHTLAYAHDGREYYFIHDKVKELDGHILNAHKQGVLITMILLNSPKLFGSTGEKALLEACLHPNYDYNCPEAYISAFDMRTEEGQGYFRAFVEFLCERYTRPDALYGRVAGAIIGNEINSQYVWGNAGEMSAREYAREYERALRMAFLCGRKHCQSFRVYASLDQHFHNHTHNMLYPLRYYAGRDMLDYIADYSMADGDFPWHIAYHPYPEDLRWPDFWHDRAPDFTFSTPKITFKNMEVLGHYIEQERMLYRGECRRVIFSEQGFNSHDGALKPLTERMAAAGYALAYLKARNMPMVDMFMHHAYTDNPREFGLNLGIRRYDPDAPMRAGEKKPVYFAVMDMDTPREADRVKQARAFIGEELFDYLLDPPIVRGERDKSKDGEFG